MPQPDTLAGVEFTDNGPFRRSRRDFLTGTAGKRRAGDDYWIRVHRRALACRFEVTLAGCDAGCVSAARAALNDIDPIEGSGHALDRAAETLRQMGVAHALLSADRRSFLAVGGRGIGWQVDIVSRRQRSGANGGVLARVWLRDAAISTSLAGEQVAVTNGSHIGVIDPGGVAPAHGVSSASATAPSAEAADALSTAFLIGGAELAERYCAEHHGVIALIAREDGSLPMTFGSSSAARVET